jgi:hypothetical protein
VHSKQRYERSLEMKKRIALMQQKVMDKLNVHYFMKELIKRGGESINLNMAKLFQRVAS